MQGMKKWIGLAALLLVSVIPAKAQEGQVPSWELGGGYTFRSYVNPFPFGDARLQMNGWNVSADYMVFRKWLSVAGQADGTYQDQGLNGKTSVYSAMIGPQLYPLGHRRLTLYGHVLFGEGYTRFVVPAQGGFGTETNSSNHFAWQGGVGIDYAWRPHWTIRALQFDYEDTKFFNSSVSQGNYKISVGILYRFGKLKKGR
jgi:hypothetical protein